MQGRKLYSQLLEPAVITAINRYLRYLPTQTVEINTALATRTVPILLQRLIKEEILKASIREIRQVLLNLFERQLRDRHTFHVSYQTAEWERECARYHEILLGEPELYDYVQMRKMLYLENAVEFDKQAARIKYYYNYERINEHDYDDIFNKFVHALRPQAVLNGHFCHALEELDRLPNRKKDIDDRKFTMLRILYEQKLKSGIKDSADKKKRINFLIDAIKNIRVDEHTDLHSFARAIISWQLAKYHHKTNDEVFHPTKMHTFFHPNEKHIGKFINQCLSLALPGHYVTEYKSQGKDQVAGTVPHEYLALQVEMM